MIIFFALVQFQGDPFQEYLSIEEKYYHLLLKMQNLNNQKSKVEKEIKTLREKEAVLTKEKEQILKEVSCFSGVNFQFDQPLPVIFTILSPRIKEQFYIEKEIEYLLIQKLEKLSKIEGEFTDTEQTLQKNLNSLKKLSKLTREIISNVEEKRRKKINVIKKIVSNQKELKKYLAYKRKNIGSINVTYEEEAPIQQIKGKLEFPAAGKIITPYGEYYDSRSGVKLFSPGIVIKTPPLTPVKAIYTGKVIFAGPVKGYDYVVIISHPGNFFSVYGRLGVTLVRKGNNIITGQIIGVVADYKKDSSLYFELRKGEKPINPREWITGNSR